MNIEIEHYRRKNDQERVEIGTDIYEYAFPGTPFEQEIDNLDLEGFEIDPKDREHYTLNLNLRPELNAIINSKASLDFELTSHQNPNNTMKFQAQ